MEHPSAEIIRRARQGVGWTINDAAKALKRCSPTTLPDLDSIVRSWKRWEAGTEPNRFYRPLLAKVLDLDEQLLARGYFESEVGHGRQVAAAHSVNPPQAALAGTSLSRNQLTLTGWSRREMGTPVYRVAICGSRARGTNNELIDDAVRALGLLLMHHVCQVSHGPVGVGIEVMTYIADHYRPPNLGSVTGILGRLNVVRDADFVLVIGGSAGTRDEVDMACSMQKRMVPLPASGGSARYAYGLMQREPRAREWLPEKDFTGLAVCTRAADYTMIVEHALATEPGVHA